MIFPLTAAITRMYGVRGDGAYPIGAFYTVNIDAGVWRWVEGVWYVPTDPEHLNRRSIWEADVDAFVTGIVSGDAIVLPSGRAVTWEAIPAEVASQLPPARR